MQLPHGARAARTHQTVRPFLTNLLLLGDTLFESPISRAVPADLPREFSRQSRLAGVATGHRTRVKATLSDGPSGRLSRCVSRERGSATGIATFHSLFMLLESATLDSMSGGAACKAWEADQHARARSLHLAKRGDRRTWWLGARHERPPAGTRRFRHDRSRNRGTCSADTDGQRAARPCLCWS